MRGNSHVRFLGGGRQQWRLATRPTGLLKSDKRDALALGNHLYNQLEKGVQLAERSQLVRQALPPIPAAIELKALVGCQLESPPVLPHQRILLVARYCLIDDLTTWPGTPDCELGG